MSGIRRGRASLAAVAMGCVLASGCGVAMPDTGPVHVTNATGSDRGDGSVSIKPRSPAKGDSPEEIVLGFLDAMTETPAITTTVARQFLTQDEAVNWQPSGMVIYGGVDTVPEASPRGNNGVEVNLVQADHIDSRGAWLGPVPEDQTTVGFEMALEDGKEWRIAQPPPYLMVPKTWFEQRFQQASLYFFDSTSTMLVPEPVFVPTDQQFASSLVSGLLQGPSPDMYGTEKNFVPSGLRSLSVLVSAAGLAKVELTSDTDAAAAVSPEQTDLLVSQLAWTLAQVPTIKHFRVSIDGRPVQLPGEAEFRADHGHGYAPFVAGSSTQLFGLKDGLMVGGSSQNLANVSGPFGQSDYGLRTIATDLRAENVAGVTTAGDTLLVGPVKDSGEQPRTLLAAGQDLLRPAWDFSGRLWEVDRQETGAVVYYERNEHMLPLEIKGISGEDVKHFLVSRDGTRLIAVLRDPTGNDSIVVSRILTSSDGQVIRADRAHVITAPEDLQGQVRDIAWRTPTTLAVLRPVTKELYQVRTASVDGANSLTPPPIAVDGDVLGLAGTPVPGSDTYAFEVVRDPDSDVVTAAGLSALDGPRDNLVQVDPRVTMLSYVG